MAAETEIQKVLKDVLLEITPTLNEAKEMKAVAASIERKVIDACKEFGVDAIVRVEGSIAKGTWLKGDPDIDVFMRLPPSIPRKSLGEISLKIARKATKGSEQIERFAEHPYLEAFIDGVRVNIVPCYDVKPGEWLSATDRTPFHTDYINKNMNKNLRGETRLLKKFMKGIGVYGAEIKTGGFSGYLCELLTVHYGSFINVLETFAQHMLKRVVDIKGYYEDRFREIELFFAEPLVVVDPVDKARNVASAVQPQRLQHFVAASQAFLKLPHKNFFNPPTCVPLPSETLKQRLNTHGSDIIFLTFPGVKTVPDILWGQLYRTKRSLRKLLELNDFKVLRDAVWTGENLTPTILVFELEQRILPITKKHLGPPLMHEKECTRFISKYVHNEKVLAGPYIENDRWVVQIIRKHTDAVELLNMQLKDGGRSVGVAELISQSICNQFTVLVNSEVTFHVDNVGFAEFITDFLIGKPFWLQLQRYL